MFDFFRTYDSNDLGWLIKGHLQMALDLGGNKKKQNDKSKYSIVELSLFKPGKKKYAEFDYEVIRKKQLKEGDSSGDDERFHDKEALEIVKRLEAKYGGRKDKKGRKIQFGTEDDFMDKRAGYDLDDDFIDDSEAVLISISIYFKI
uniref:HUN domain-containing protein n=1 Tax=Heterorhabditis bacteriophora TaxID=37862 RepID=A0A1I7XQT4_HETBA